MSHTGSMIALPMTMAKLRKNWSFEPMKDSISASAVRSSTVRARSGANVRNSRLEQPRLRWCISSPMVSPRATSGLSSIPLPARRAAPSAGPSESRSQPKRFSTDASLPPKRITFPSPSLMVQKAWLPLARFSTTSTGWLSVVIPVIGPTAPKSWFGLRRNAPDSANRSASARSVAQPSKTAMPATAPRIGPHMFPQSIGGPA